MHVVAIDVIEVSRVRIAVESTVGETDNGFPTVTFTLHLRRQPLYYVVNLIVPCCLLSLIAVTSFLLQPGCSDRLAIGTYLFDVINMLVLTTLGL